ncbi:MAG TPA: response regulator transcription factor [Bryobacteraceae bacterium]|nr:response regulator transcription factor [Bryobacteraceae bacterium]
MAEATRVAIIDDDQVLVDGLRRIIDGAEGFVCAGAFGSVEEALPSLSAAHPEVLLLDIQLPGLAGDEAVEVLRRTCPGVEILMLTVFSERSKVFTSICNGANGYLLKSTPPAKLLDAIRSAKAGGSPISPEIARQIIGLFQKTAAPQPPVELTQQEQRVLALLAEGYSYQSAADQMRVSVNTIRNYVRKVYEKLHVHSKSEAVSKALRRGVI